MRTVLVGEGGVDIENSDDVARPLAGTLKSVRSAWFATLSALRSPQLGDNCAHERLDSRRGRLGVDL